MLASRRIANVLRQARVAMPVVGRSAFHAAVKPSFVAKSAPMQLRFMATAKSSLTEELAKEIEFEEGEAEVDTEYEDAKKLILASGFKLEEKPGNSLVKLTRKHKNETIVVKFHVQDTAGNEFDEDEQEAAYSGESENDLDTPLGINLEVSVIKGNNKLVLLAVGGETLAVQGIRIMPANVSETEESEVYSGPAFDELQEEVQEAFLDWLEERKVDGDLAFFVLAHSRVKEQNEYVHWLHAVQEFCDDGKLLPTK